MSLYAFARQLTRVRAEELMSRQDLISMGISRKAQQEFLDDLAVREMTPNRVGGSLNDTRPEQSQLSAAQNFNR